MKLDKDDLMVVGGLVLGAWGGLQILSAIAGLRVWSIELFYPIAIAAVILRDYWREYL